MMPSENVHAPISPIHLPSRMKMIGCKELFAEFFVDPTEAQRCIPSGYKLRMSPDGKAILLMMLQDWEKCILDGILPIQRIKMSHIWIEVIGPDEVGPALPGTEASLPTSYYFALPHQIDNKLAVAAFKLAGIDVQRINRIEVIGKPGENQIIKVIERENPTIGYSWEASGGIWSAPKVLTGRRWFYRNYGRHIKRNSAGLVVCRSRFFGDGKVRMTLDSGSTMASLGFHAQQEGELKYVTTDCDCIIRVGMEYPSNR